MFRCIDGVLDLCFLVGLYMSTGKHTEVKDFKREYCAVGLGSSPAWVSWLTGAGVRLFCQLRSSQLYHEFSKRWVFILVTLSGSSSPQPRIRLTPRHASHPASWFQLHLFAASLPFPILFPSSLPDLPTIWTWDELLFIRAVLTRQPPLWWLSSIVFHLKITNRRLTSLVLSIAFKMAMFRLSRDDSTLRYSPRCWEK